MTATLDGSGAREALAREIVRQARAAGLPAATVMRGIDGFAPHTGLWDAGCPGPLVVVVTGDPESVDDLVVGVAPLLAAGALTVEDVDEIVPGAAAPC